MVDLTELEGLRDELVRARASGELQVSFEGKTVRYRSVAELTAALARVEADIVKLKGERRPTRVRRYVTRTGWSR